MLVSVMTNNLRIWLINKKYKFLIKKNINKIKINKNLQL